jgi:hypothetical protein
MTRERTMPETTKDVVDWVVHFIDWLEGVVVGLLFGFVLGALVMYLYYAGITP